jgi:hypothetical protein
MNYSACYSLQRFLECCIVDINKCNNLVNKDYLLKYGFTRAITYQELEAECVDKSVKLYMQIAFIKQWSKGRNLTVSNDTDNKLIRISYSVGGV